MDKDDLALIVLWTNDFRKKANRNSAVGVNNDTITAKYTVMQLYCIVAFSV